MHRSATTNFEFFNTRTLNFGHPAGIATCSQDTDNNSDNDHQSDKGETFLSVHNIVSKCFVNLIISFVKLF